MFLEWLTNNLMEILFTFFGGGGVLWALIERKQRKADVKKSQADALQSMQEAYDKFVCDMQTRYQESLSLIENLKIECNNLKLKQDDIKKDSLQLERNLNNVKLQLSEEKAKYETLKRDYEDLQRNYNTLKKDYERLKKEVNKKL